MFDVFDSIVGQDWAVSYLKGAARRGRQAQAMIFHGPPFVGKETTALAFAALQLCDNETGCGTCRSCVQVSLYQHPDLHYFFPCPAAWYKNSSARGELMAARVEQEHRIGEPMPDPNLLISIEAVREMNRIASRSSFGGKGRVIIVRSANRMREEAQNAFLKLLEEAPRNVYIVLLTTRPREILPTVRSRSHSVRFSSMREEAWIEVFRRIREVDEERARLLHRLSCGSLSKAVLLLVDEQTGLREIALDLFSDVHERRAGEWARIAVQHLGPRGERKELDTMIESALFWARDALFWRGEETRMMLVNVDRWQDVSRVAKRFGTRLLISLIEELERLRQAVHLNLDPMLVCYRMEWLVRAVQVRQ